MKPRYEKVSEGFYCVYVGDLLICQLYKNPNFKTLPWIIEKANGMTVSFDHSYDCFTWLEARRIISNYCKKLTKETTILWRM